MGRKKIPLETKLQNFRVDEETGCHRWQQALNRRGYGLIHVDGKIRAVHRVAYEFWVGPIPDGYDIDHVRAWGCRHRDCINPRHLEAVTPQENRARVVQGCQDPTHERRPVQVNGRQARRCVTCQSLWQKYARGSLKGQVRV